MSTSGKETEHLCRWRQKKVARLVHCGDAMMAEAGSKTAPMVSKRVRMEVSRWFIGLLSVKRSLAWHNIFERVRTSGS